VLFPELRKHHAAPDVERQLHRDHAALAALLVPPPTHAEIEQIASILESHHVIVERGGGLYDVVEALSGSELAALMERVHALPEVRVAPHADSPILRQSIAHLVREAEAGRAELLRQLS
jgi:hypothetical protein